MLLNLIRNGLSFEMVAGMAASVFVLLCTLPAHEFAHAWASHKLGDDTAMLGGRMTLNPFAHLDPVGSILILLVGFGYAKPVPVNIRNFKNPKRDMALTALAGPVSNLIMAFLFLLISGIPRYMLPNGGAFAVMFNYFFYYAALINVSLAVFNLLPVPPLDGSRIFTAVLPDKFYYRLMQYERYIAIALFILLITGTLSGPLMFLSRLVFKAISGLASLPFAPFK
jgi:Zn-dependent protease